jgi:hypothetical protein
VVTERTLSRTARGHYSSLLLERMRWAVADAEAVEAGGAVASRVVDTLYLR